MTEPNRPRYQWRRTELEANDPPTDFARLRRHRLHWPHSERDRLPDGGAVIPPLQSSSIC